MNKKSKTPEKNGVSKNLEKKLKKLEIAAATEYQHRISEIPLGKDYSPVFFSEIKYKSNENIYIDIRQFRRGYDDEGDTVYYPTKIGFRILKDDLYRIIINKMTLIPSAYLHHDIMKNCFSLMSAEKYENAVTEAFKIVEIIIREKAGLSNEDHGVKLIRKAFHPETGTLTDKSLPFSERESMANYIAGAYGVHRNPSSHRKVKLTFVEAFERIVVASNILNMIEARFSQS